MEGPINGQLYATVGTICSLDNDTMITSSSSPGHLDTSNHRSGGQGHRYQPPMSPHDKASSATRSHQQHAETRRSNALDFRNTNDGRNHSNHHHGTRKHLDHEMSHHPPGQDSSVNRRVAPMWSPSSDVISNHRHDSVLPSHPATHRSTTQAEIEKIDDILQELTPRLNDSPSEYLRRRRQSFSNSSKTATTFEGRARQDTFIQGFSPTSPVDGRDYGEGSRSNCVEPHQVICATVARAPIVELSGSHTNQEVMHTKVRVSSWHSEEKKKLQRARSLLDEKDKFLTEQLRRYQTRSGAREDAMMSPLGYRPGSSQQVMVESASGRYSSYANKDYIPVSEWEDVRMFSDHYYAGQARRATSEMDYPLRDISVDRRNPSPVVSAGAGVPRRRPFIRHFSDKAEISYPRPRQPMDAINAYRAYSPHAARYMNGSPAHADDHAICTDDIPQVQRRNIRSTVHTSRLITNTTHQHDASKTMERNIECLPISGIGRPSGQLSPTQPHIDHSNLVLLKDIERGSGTPELLKKSRNSGFQIRADNSTCATGISYYDPDDAYLSSDGYPLASKLSVSRSPTDQPVEPKPPHPQLPTRRPPHRPEEPLNQMTLEENLLRGAQPSNSQDSDPTCLHPNRQSSNATKPVNAHNSNNSSIRKSAKIWYQPHMSRDEAIKHLRTKPAGSFLVRQSHTFSNSYGLAVKVPRTNQNEDEDRTIRHFLIESNSKGVRIRGCANEPYFGSLTALVHQHTITKLALPCCITLPCSGLDSDTEEQQVTFDITNPTKSNFTKTTAVFAPRTFVALYLGSIDTELLTGPAAISKAVEVLLENRGQVKQTEVSIRVSQEGLTLTDVLRKLFFRRHYPLGSISYCGLESNACWESQETRARGVAKARIFGFVARKTSANDNMCHMLCECNAQDSARSITHFIAGCVAIS